MSPESVQIELDEKFLKDFFSLAGSKMPETVDNGALSSALNKIKTKLSSAKSNHEDTPQDHIPEGDIKVLIIDNVGFVMHRLKQMLSKQNVYVDTTEDINKAIERINKVDFTHIVMNLLMPTEREGMMYLKEIYKTLEKTQSSTEIILTGESIKKELITLFKERGINHVIERKLDWLPKLLAIFNPVEE